jgi:DNA repair protein RecO (recombination protein O)
MLHHTRGIVFHQVKYSETSLIVKIYTEQFGLQSYMIRGIRSKKSLIKPALLQPFTLIDLVVYHKEKKDLQHIKEIQIAYPFKSIPFDIRKSSVLIFLNEILIHVIREQESNPGLFQFIYNSIESFDLMDQGIADFHLRFMMELTRHLGFYPKNNFSAETCAFNMQEGIFTHQTLSSNTVIPKPYSDYFAALASTGAHPVQINPSHRPILLEYMIRYYKLHIPGIHEIKSHSVLQVVLND